MNYVIRAAKPGDLQSIYEMAKLTGGGFTNLPPDKKALRAKLERTEASFASDKEYPSDELYLLVLEDMDSGEVRGTCQIFGQVGQRWPFYSYRIGTDSKHSEQLGRTFHAQVLMLSNDLNGASEVGGLFLHPSERAGGLGLLLARSRYLFIAMHRPRFADRVIAELRGIIDERGGSPFWDGVAGRFFGMSFQEADYFNAINGNQFIADLMPKHPVYVAMLSESARSAIGVPHPSGRAAMRMLEEEGFAYEGYVDIFDGGPTMIARTDQVKSIMEARAATVARTDCRQGAKVLLAAGRLASFRCCYGLCAAAEGGIAIDAAAADVLNLREGDEVWSVRR